MEEPIDIYTDSTPDSPSEAENALHLDLISITEVLYILRQASDYVTETRGEFETIGPIEWVSNTASTIENAISGFTSLQIQYADSLVEYAENDEAPVEILKRTEENESDFDSAMSAFELADDAFKNYFDKHIKLIKDNAGIE